MNDLSITRIVDIKENVLTIKYSLPKSTAILCVKYKNKEGELIEIRQPIDDSQAYTERGFSIKIPKDSTLIDINF